MKLNNPAIWAGTAGGSIRTLVTDNFNVAAFVRTKGGNRVITVVNLTGSKQVVNVSTTAGSYFALGATKATKFSTSVKITLAASSYALYSTKP